LLPRNYYSIHDAGSAGMFQSQTRRLLPRNDRKLRVGPGFVGCFNRRRDACFPATSNIASKRVLEREFQSQTRRLLPRNATKHGDHDGQPAVSIADATLASPQRLSRHHRWIVLDGFNRRRDACFPATPTICYELLSGSPFQSQTRRLLPRNISLSQSSLSRWFVSIADATLASPQPTARFLYHAARYCFNRRRDACFPATPMSLAQSINGS